MSADDLKTHQKIGLALTGARDIRVKILGAAITAPRETWTAVKALLLAVCVIVSLIAVPAFFAGVGDMASATSASNVAATVVIPGIFSLLSLPVLWKMRGMFRPLCRSRLWTSRSNRNVVWDAEVRLKNQKWQKRSGIALTVWGGYVMLKGITAVHYSMSFSPIVGVLDVVRFYLVPAAIVGGFWAYYFKLNRYRREDEERHTREVAEADAAAVAARNAYLADIHPVHTVLRQSLYLNETNEAYKRWRATEADAREVSTADIDRETSFYTPEDWTIFFSGVLGQAISITEPDSDENRILTVRVPTGKTDNDALQLAEPLESALELLRVEPLADRPVKGTVEMMLVRKSPLDRHLPALEAPVLHMTKEQMADPYYVLPVGIDSRGKPWGAPLFQLGAGGQRIKTSGASGSGKSSAFKQHVLQAVKCDNVRVFLIDGKGSELGEFDSYAQQVAKTGEQALELLKYWNEYGIERSSILDAKKKKGGARLSETLNPDDDDEPLALLAWDEPFAVQTELDGDWKKAMAYYRSSVSQGRSRGMTHLLSGQTFPTELIPGSIRGNFDGTMGARSANPTDSEMSGFTKDDIVVPHKIKGEPDLATGMFSTVGQFATKGLGAPTYVKSYYVAPFIMREHLFRLTNAEVMKLTD